MEEAKHWIQKWQNEEELLDKLVRATNERDLTALKELVPRAKQTTLRDSTEYEEAVAVRDELMHAQRVRGNSRL